MSHSWFVVSFIRIEMNLFIVYAGAGCILAKGYMCICLI